jgi:hypothetical protein
MLARKFVRDDNKGHFIGREGSEIGLILTVRVSLVLGT